MIASLVGNTVSRGILLITFISVFVIFEGILDQILYVFGFIFGIFSAFYSYFCYIGVSSDAIDAVSVLSLGFGFALLVLLVYKFFK